MTLEGLTILVTGGTGSFGQKFTEIALKEENPKALRIYSRGEFLQSEMAQKFDDSRLRFFIGDVRDKARLYRALEGVDIVVHAAALKQVPTVEYNPIEAVNTNIIGAINVIDAALDTDVKKVLAIGSDKEVHATNLYGATKLVAEKLFVQANAYTGKGETRFSCSRYGNVIGSRGSVIPLFLKQREAGEITVTDERMTRFWLSLEQGVRFVISCLDRMQGEEVFIPKIPSMRLVDVAKVVAPEARVKVVGIRPGEKLHELLIAEEESRRTLEYEDCFIVLPEFSFRDRVDDGKGRLLGEDVRYGSDTNEWWLTGDELKGLIGKELISG